MEDGPLYTEDYDLATDTLAIGDVFVVIAPSDNDELVEYYLLRCTMVKSKLLCDTKDGFGIEFDRYSMVVGGNYFKQLGKRGRYVEYVDYEANCEAIIYSHLVIATKLPLTRVHTRRRTASRYRLPIEDHESIITIVNSRDDLVD